MVAAEQNFNPFVVSVPSICSDPTLPKTAALRGVVPLIDPAVGGSTLENANSKTSITTPFTADGLSVAQVMIAQGFSNFTAVALDGTSVPASSLGSGGAAAVVSEAASSSTASSSTTVAVETAAAAVSACAAPTTMVTVTVAVCLPHLKAPNLETDTLNRPPPPPPHLLPLQHPPQQHPYPRPPQQEHVLVVVAPFSARGQQQAPVPLPTP